MLISSVQRSLSFPAVYAQQGSKIWDQVMDGLRRQIQLRLDDASLHQEADQWRPREEPGDEGCAWREGLRGHNVTFFTLYELGRQLLKGKITTVGKVRKNKPELPPALRASKEREVLSSKFPFTPTTTLVSYLPKKNKNVVLLSTLHTEAEISDRQDRKPAIILDYNCNQGGVDHLDTVTGTYSCRRMTARWPLVIFHNIVDVSSYNAFVIWREINPSWTPCKRNKRRVFLEQLGKTLVTPFIERREHLPAQKHLQQLWKLFRRLDLVINPRIQLPQPVASKRKRCQICPPKKDCKTHTVCRRCKKYICKGCALAYCPTCANWGFSEGGHGVYTEYEDNGRVKRAEAKATLNPTYALAPSHHLFETGFHLSRISSLWPHHYHWCFSVLSMCLSPQALCGSRRVNTETAPLPPWGATSSPAPCPHAETEPAQRENTHSLTCMQI